MTQARQPSDVNLEKGHGNVQQLSINNSFLRRYLTIAALKTTARFFRRRGSCQPISRRLIVKTGPEIDLTEACTLDFVAAKTSVPVPRVVCSFVRNGRAYIVMRRISGVTVAQAWPSLSEAERASILDQLREMFIELRKLAPPSGAVQSCTYGSLRDSRIPKAEPRFGPFNSIQVFHAWLRDGLQADQTSAHQNAQDINDVSEMIRKQDGPWPSPVFTHGDLNPFNIIVRGTQVVGIIDWEFSGWYPHYWEYTSAWYGNRNRPDWQRSLSSFLEADHESLKMEITRQKWWGDF